MDLRHLKSFVVLAEDLNFSRAAVRLHISQPPLTRQIQLMESELGAPLFEQSSGNENLATTIALGLGIWQIQPDLTAGTVIGEDEIGGEERRRFFKAKPCSHQEIREQRIADTVAISGARACVAVRQKRF